MSKFVNVFMESVNNRLLRRARPIISAVTFSPAFAMGRPKSSNTLLLTVRPRRSVRQRRSLSSAAGAHSFAGVFFAAADARFCRSGVFLPVGEPAARRSFSLG